jgi:flagellar biosynthesis GTPase FlhF
VSTPGDLLEALGREARARLGGARGRASDVRVYRGRNVDELIPQIEQDLGADALIVRRREGLSGGVLGFFQRAFVEIEAVPGHPRLDAYDEADEDDDDLSGGFVPDPVQPPIVQVPPPSPVYQAPPIQPPAPQPPAPEAYAPTYTPPGPQRYAAAVAPPAPRYKAPAPLPMASGSYVTDRLAALARYAPPPPPPPPPPSPPPAPAPPRVPESYGASVDFQELLAPERPRRPAPVTHAQRATPATPEKRTVAPGSQGRARAGVEKGLLRYGLSEAFAAELVDLASAHTLPLSPRAGLAQAVRATLAQRIPVAPTLPVSGATVVLVGPGGSGKTTSCMALLGAYRAASTLPASYATLTRAGGEGELRMLLAPHVVKPLLATSARALRALRRVRVDGLAILDTPTLSPADRTGIRELTGLLAEIKPERVAVALPATLGAAAADQLLEAFAPLNADSLVITHAEETDQIGVAVEAACRHGLAPEHLLRRDKGVRWRLERIDPVALATRMLR